MTHAKRLWALDAPTFYVENCQIMVGGTGWSTVPLPAYLIEHPKGLVLFDTGLVPAAADDPEAVYGPLAEFLRISFTREQRLDNQLRALGYKLEDVTHVIASHTHLDHSGGLYLFPEAKFYAGAGELRYGMWPDTAGAAYFRQLDLEPTRAFDWYHLDRDHDLFGDGSVVVLHTPGHTPGELSLLVRLRSRNFVLTGDTVHLRQGLEQELPMPYDTNTEQSIQSIQRLKLIRDSADATVWISHDPEDWAEFDHAPSCYE